MAKKDTKRRKPTIRRPKVAFCFFCKEKKTPDYKQVDALEKFTTDRGKIVSRSYNGLCQRHQRQLSKAVKRARFLALLPFATQV